MKIFSNLRLSKVAVALVFSFINSIANAQLSKTLYPEGFEEFIYPVHPGQPGSLAGTMGELRTTHFHSGIDIRTNNMTGYPVVASKSGYISRATMTPSGYGNILYITHPDGHTTLYAHLQNFVGPVADHVLKEQYRQKTFSIDLAFPRGQFPVKQGELIALSGNTGSSGGPHVHFDIRDPNNFALDPLKVAKFPEIVDRLPPAPEKIALKTLDKHSRINDKFGRFEFHASSKGGSKYSMASPILASGTIGIEVIAKDRLAPGSPFYGGVNHIEMRLNGELIFSQNIDKIDISETRAIYTLMDFKTMRNKGSRFYKLYVDDGNNLDFYQMSPASGKIYVPSDKVSKVNIRLKDSYGNQSEIDFEIMPTKDIEHVPHLEQMTSAVFSDVIDNTLSATFRSCNDTAAVAALFRDGQRTELQPDYFNSNRSVFLIDLRRHLPDSIVYCNRSVVTNFKKMITPSSEQSYSSDFTEVRFPAGVLYDTLYFTASYDEQPNGEFFSIGDRDVPLKKSVEITLKPKHVYNPAEGFAVYRVAGKGRSFIGGDFRNGNVNFSTRDFGVFTILKDDTAPSIKPVYVDRNGVRFRIKDDLSGIDSIEANIAGHWLLMHYDSKTGTIWSEKLDKNAPLKGAFELVVTDNAGNKKVYSKQIP